MDNRQVATGIIRLLNTAEASMYLAERGIMRTPLTLRKYRCTGEGPRYRKIGKRDVAYEPPALDAWAASLISPELHSTAETIAA